MSTDQPNSPPPPQPTRGPVRWLLLGIGVLLTGVAALGAILPVLPTTPFLLLAMAAFSRSSPGLRRKLLEAPVFGIYLRQWNHDRSIPRHAKWKAYGLILVTVGLSAYGIPSNWARLVLVVVAAGLVLFLHSLPITEHEVGQFEEETIAQDKPNPAETVEASAREDQR